MSKIKRTKSTRLSVSRRAGTPRGHEVYLARAQNQNRIPIEIGARILIMYDVQRLHEAFSRNNQRGARAFSDQPPYDTRLVTSSLLNNYGVHYNHREASLRNNYGVLDNHREASLRDHYRVRDNYREVLTTS